MSGARACRRSARRAAVSRSASAALAARRPASAISGGGAIGGGALDAAAADSSRRPGRGRAPQPSARKGPSRAAAGLRRRWIAAAPTTSARPRAGRTRARQAAGGEAAGRDAARGARSPRALARITPQRGHSGVETAVAPQRGQSMGRAVAREGRRLYTNRLRFPPAGRGRGDPVKTASTAREDRVGPDAQPGGRRAHEAGDGARRRRSPDAPAGLRPRPAPRPPHDPEGQHLLAPALPLGEQHALAAGGGGAHAARGRLPGPARACTTRPWSPTRTAGDRLNKFAGVYRRYEVPTVDNFSPDCRWVTIEPKAQLLVLDRIFGEVRVPEVMLGTQRGAPARRSRPTSTPP